MAQDIIVGLIVAAAVLYVAWRYLPQGWRQRLGRVHPALVQAPGCGGGDSGGGCSSCGNGSGGGGSCGPSASSPSEVAEKTVTMPRSRR